MTTLLPFLINYISKKRSLEIGNTFVKSSLYMILVNENVINKNMEKLVGD